MTELTQHARLARPIPPEYVKPPATGKHGDYVPHHIVNQIVLKVCGPHDFRVEQFIYGKDGMVEGCTASMTLTIDGRVATVTECGDCEHPDNKKTQGDRMKDAASDAYKRCAMRFGLGLHLWSRDHYFLFRQLTAQDRGEGEAVDGRAPEAKPSPRASRVPPVIEPGDAPVVLDAIEDLSAYSSAPM